MDAKDSIVLVTGANRGIGKGFVEEFLKAGAQKIYMGVRRPNEVMDVAAHYPSRCIPLHLDVTNSKHIAAAAKKAQDVNVLINNAGVFYNGNLMDEDRIEKARHEMEVNFFGPLSMTRAFAPVIEANGGGVIANMASVAGLVIIPQHPTYCPSKAAVHFLTLETRLEFSGRGIHVMGIYPGPVDTDMARSYDLDKVSIGHVARETIRAMEAEELNVFPDPHLKDIYAVLHSEKKYASGDIMTILSPESKAA